MGAGWCCSIGSLRESIAGDGAGEAVLDVVSTTMAGVGSSAAFSSGELLSSAAT